MSIKDLFGKSSPSLEETVQDVESVAFVEEKTKADQTYHPQIDFSDPENFVYYGSAELYYDAAIRRIYEDYPYDGSKSEQIEFEERASALERWVFDNKYPKTTGHVQLGTSVNLTGLSGQFATTSIPEYIRVWGGLHTDSSANNLYSHFENSARYDDEKNRNQNWNCDLDQGVTVEFWMKKPDGFDVVNEPIEVILDLWNGDSTPTGENRLMIMVSELSGIPQIIFQIKTDGNFDSHAITLTDHLNWKHYAASFQNDSTQTVLRLYVDGEEVLEYNYLNLHSSFQGRVDGFIGALQAPAPSGLTGGEAYAGKLSAQLDEFRFWKTRRTSRQIKLNWFREVGGGANTDDATSDLGVYLKFNEGIVGNNAIDSVVLDYSGRLANGQWVGYESTTGARSTDSAMDLSGYTEKPSPIIYKQHSDVSALISEMQTSGSIYDADRGQSFFRSMPSWLQEEDNGNLRLFSQILGSYLDTLHVQIKELTELKTKRYPMEGVKASTMAADLLKDKGFMISNMFESNEVYEKLASVNLQDAQFETELHEIKNIIYTNIYNNLEKIYKTKGTEGSIRNLIRCYGIDDELIKLNLYTDGGTQYFTDKSRATSVKKKYVNFNHPTRFEASIHQTGSTANPNSFISGAVEAPISAFTMEADIVVPYKKEIDERGYFNTPFLSASVMGFHEADPTDSADLTWGTQNLSVYLVRDSLNSRHAKFVMRDVLGTINEESDYIYDIYENEHYNVALRIKPQTYPYAGGVTNTTPDYDIELYAVTTNFGEIENEVLLTASVAYPEGSALLTAPKRVYAGAHVENFTGSIEQETDLQFGGVRAWLDYLDNDEILNHNKDVLNYGQRSSIDGSNLYLIDDVQIPTQDLTILNWDFDTVTTTDGSGEFIVEDTTSGSADTIYGWVDGIIRREHKAKGTDFASNDSSIIDYEFIQAYKKQLPESAYDAQNIYIKGEQEINFSDDDDVSDNLFIMEKSPASLISEEMLKSFSTTLEFANLFMRPIERFRVEYKDMARARELFFNKVESDMDFDRFFEYFKWIDSSISSMVNQLIPMSANFAGGIVDVIEPHILERDKYQRQVGLLSTVTSTEASIRGAQELKFNWRVGHAPLSGDDNENCLWQKERKERGEPEESTERIRQVLVSQNALTASNPINLSGSNGIYDGRTYATRRLSRPYTLDVGFSNSIHGGINYSINKDRDAITQQIAPGNSSNAGTPENVVIIGAGVGTGTNPKPACIDEHKPEELRKYKYDGFAVLGRHSTLATQEPKSDADHYIYRQKISKIIPGNIVSSSVNTGYSSLINKDAASGGFGEGFDLVNLHSDTTDITNEISIQGPFTHTHIGGRQARHVHYMEGFDPSVGKIPNISVRPEAWNIYIAEFDATETEVGAGVGDGALGFTTPDYSVGPLDSDQQKATFYREERAKRPVNIKNIQTIIETGSHGNFTYNYEVMSTFGDQGYFLRRADDLLPGSISQALPETTNYQTLIAQTASNAGNYFGNGNNRQFLNENVASTASFSYHQDNNLAFLPEDLPNILIRIERANSDSSFFAITSDPSYSTGDLFTGYTVVSTLGTTWSNVGDQFELAITHPTNGFGSDLSVTFDYNPIGTKGKTVTIALKEEVLIGSNGNGGSIADLGVSSHLDIITAAFEGGGPIANPTGNITATQDRSTGSANVIRTRFSAPGGPEVISPGYLDITSQQYSVYNSINFRNLTTRINGSGEIGTIRVDSHSSRREGLRMLRTRHQGQFGIDSTHGSISATDYVAEASFHKQHRNKSLIPTSSVDEYGNEVIGTSPRYDNDHYHRPLPASDIGYSWINYSVSGSEHGVSCMMGYAPKSGMRMTEDGWKEAIDFPSISDVRLDDCSQDPVALLFATWGDQSQFSHDSETPLVLIGTSNNSTTQTLINVNELDTLDLGSTNVGCSLATPQFSLVQQGQPRSFQQSVSLPNLFFNPENTLVFDYASSRGGLIRSLPITLRDVSLSEPTLTSIAFFKQRFADGSVSFTTALQDFSLTVVPFDTSPATGELTLSEASETYHNYFQNNITCDDPGQELYVNGQLVGEFDTDPDWSNFPTLYYRSGFTTTVASRVVLCSDYFQDDIVTTIPNTTINPPTLEALVTFHDNNLETTRNSKTLTVVPDTATPGVGEITESQANQIHFITAADGYLADNSGDVEYVITENDFDTVNSTQGPQANLPTIQNQIFYIDPSTPSSLEVTMTARTTTGFIVESTSTITLQNAAFTGPTYEIFVRYPEHDSNGGLAQTENDVSIIVVEDSVTISRANGTTTLDFGQQGIISTPDGNLQANPLNNFTVTTTYEAITESEFFNAITNTNPKVSFGTRASNLSQDCLNGSTTFSFQIQGTQNGNPYTSVARSSFSQLLSTEVSNDQLEYISQETIVVNATATEVPQQGGVCNETDSMSVTFYNVGYP